MKFNEREKATLNPSLINAAALCIILCTPYLAAREVWTFVEYRQFYSRIQDEQTKAALRDVLGK